MRKPGGYAFITSPVPSVIQFEGRREYAPAGVFETDTCQCGHCGGQAHVRPRVDAADDVGALCKKCMKVVCRRCVNEGRRTGISCDTLEAKLERWERAG